MTLPGAAAHTKSRSARTGPVRRFQKETAVEIGRPLTCAKASRVAPQKLPTAESSDSKVSNTVTSFVI